MILIQDRNFVLTPQWKINALERGLCHGFKKKKKIELTVGLNCKTKVSL